MSTAYKDALGSAVVYSDITLGDGTKVPKSAPSDAGGNPLYAAGATPALDGTDATGVTPPVGGAGLRGWLSGIYAKLAGTLTIQGTVNVGSLPGLVNGKLPVDIGGESVTITGAVTIPGSVEISNDVGNPLPTAPQANAPRVSVSGSLGALNAALTLAVDGMATGAVQISGTWAGTISWLGSIDGGATYFPINLKPLGGNGGPSVASVTANGQWQFAVAPLTHLRATMSAYTSGSASVVLAASTGGKLARVEAPVSDPVPMQAQVGFAPVQTAVAVPAFTAGNTAGTGGTNATVVLAVTTPANPRFLSIDNTGPADAEIWFGTIPADTKVGQSPKQGKPLPAGAGLFLDAAIPAGVAIYVTAASATGLSVVTG